MCKDQSLVSIIMSVFNGERFVKDAIESVLSQTYDNWEFLIVDDGSTDNSVGIIAPYLRDKRITCIRLQENQGIPRARNVGLIEAKGSYVAFLDQDDFWYTDKLEIALDTFRRCDQVDILFSDIEIKWEDGETELREYCFYDPKDMSRDDFLKELFMKNFIKSVSQVVLKRDCLNVVGLLDELLVGGDDYDLWLRLAGECNFGRIPKVLTTVRRHTSNTSSYYSLKMKEQAISIIVPKAVEQNPSLKCLRDKRVSDLYLGMGVDFTYQHDLFKAARHYGKAILRNPTNYKAIVEFLFLPIFYLIRLSKDL